MPFKVQTLTPDGHRRGTATCISRHWKEDHVLGMIQVELPKILARGRQDLPYVYGFAVPKTFLEDTEAMFSETSSALEAGDPSGAYKRWREFVDIWEEWGISVADWWGDIIVEEVGVDKFYFYPTPKKNPRR